MTDQIVTVTTKDGYVLFKGAVQESLVWSSSAGLKHVKIKAVENMSLDEPADIDVDRNKYAVVEEVQKQPDYQRLYEEIVDAHSEVTQRLAKLSKSYELQSMANGGLIQELTQMKRSYEGAVIARDTARKAFNDEHQKLERALKSEKTQLTLNARLQQKIDDIREVINRF